MPTRDFDGMGKNGERIVVSVTSYAGYMGEQEPRAFRLGGEYLRVVGVGDRYRSPNARYFKVRADDGHGYLLCYDQSQDCWSLLRQFPSDA